MTTNSNTLKKKEELPKLDNAIQFAMKHSSENNKEVFWRHPPP